ncbi:MAG: response regulator [Verrucomicrobiae bacterium]
MSAALRILVVEDNPADADFIRETLPGSGPFRFETEWVSRLSEAISRLEGRGIDLVLLDLGLPDSQGMDSFTRLHQAMPEIPVIVLSGLNDEKLAVAAVQNGAQDFLVKGQFGGELLSRAIRYAVERKHSEVALRASEEAALSTNALLRSIMESPQGMVIFALDPNYRYTAFTESHRETMRAIWGVEIAVGMKMLDLIPNEGDREKAQRHFDRALQGDHFIEVEEYGSRDLCRTVYEDRYGPVYDEGGGVSGLTVFVTDISERRRAEEELINLRRAVEQSANTIVITNPQGNIEYVNPAFEKSSGFSAADVLGRNPRILKSGEQDAPFYRDLWVTIKSGKIWRGQFHNRHRNGSLYWESATISPILNDRGEMTRFIAVKEDITELKNLENRLRKAFERAEAANRAKSEFLANMSHEIRTPMNGVIGMTDLLLDTEQTPEQREYTEAIHACGSSLLALINDILDFSKVEAGQLALEILDFDIRTTVEDAVEIAAGNAHEKGLEVVCQIDEKIPKFLRGDPGRLRQILINLVGNAVKFTQHGSVTAQADLLAETETSATLRFRITDTGIGIPQEKQSTIFSKFIQADTSTTREFGGTGLGLAISRQLVRLFQGEIHVTSKEGKGSEFSFTAVLQKTPEGDVKPPPVEADLSGVRVLVADDFKTNRVLMTRLLESWGCRFDEAPDAASALVLLKRAAHEGDPFAAVFLDMNMPVMDGAELGRLIKGDAEIQSARLVMLTSLGKRGDAERLAGVGFSGYLPKPIRPALLRKCLALVLGRQEATGSDQELITRHTVAETSRKRLRILVAEDNTTNRIIAIKTLEKLGHLAEAVGNGREAIESLRRLPYDLVFMDCQMPVMDGFEATKKIRDPATGARNPHIPIIALTAHAMKGDRARCFDAGMNDYVSKPTGARDLAAAIERCLARSRKSEVTSEAAFTPPRDFDRDGFRERTMDDPAFAAEIAAAFLADSPKVFEQLSDAISAGDAADAGKFAHALKGSGANMGGEVLAGIAGQMQEAAKEENLPRLVELLPAARAALEKLCSLLDQECS